MVDLFNRKGAIFHWAIFGILVGVGLFLVLTTDVDTGSKSKGLWEISFVRATLESEKNLLLNDNKVVQTIEDARDELITELEKLDTGCGNHQGTSKWNSDEQFCTVDIQHVLQKVLGKKLKEATGVNYTISYQAGAIVGKADKLRVLASSLNAIPTETRSQGLFESYEAYLIRPFHLRYQYNPSFRVQIETPLSKLTELQEKARVLLHKCQKEAILKQCLDQNKEENWKYTSCHQEHFPPGRIIPFCVDEIKFVLDFGSSQAQTVSNLQVSREQDTFKLSLPLDAQAEQHIIYYTNWDPSAHLPETADNVFINMPKAAQFGYFQKSITIASPKNQNCPLGKVADQAYLCGNMIEYMFVDPLPQDIYVAAVTVQNGKQSQITQFVRT